MTKAREDGLNNLSEEQLDALDVITKGINNKLMHGPMSYMRSADRGGKKATVQQIEQLFMLGEHAEQAEVKWDPFGSRTSTSQDSAIARLEAKFEAVRHDELAKAQK